MNTKKVATEYRLSQWAQVIQKRLSSGQNIKAFCEAEGIRRNVYFYWQKKLREVACSELAKTEESMTIVPKGWMQLEAKQAHPTKKVLNIEVNDCHITVDVATDAELLKKVCHILRQL